MSLFHNDGRIDSGAEYVHYTGTYAYLLSFVNLYHQFVAEFIK